MLILRAPGYSFLMTESRLFEALAGLGEGGVGLPMVVGEHTSFRRGLSKPQVSGLFVASALVGYPHFYTGDFHTARHVWQARGETIVVVAEEMAEEEVAVLVVLVSVDREIGGLGAAVGMSRSSTPSSAATQEP